MLKSKKLSIFSLFLLLVTALLSTVVSAEGDSGKMIDVTSDWTGRVFGDCGGQERIVYENFEIRENDDRTVTMRVSNNRGKIAGSSEGLAYYFKELPGDVNYELRATARVHEWTANNQVTFGIMARSNVLEDNINDGSFTGDYIAVGAVNQEIRGFLMSDGNQQKSGYEFENSLLPAPGNVYDLSFQKAGDNYILTVNGEIQIIDGYENELNYIGLFATRNTTVAYSNVRLYMEGQVELGEYEKSFFGDVGGQDKIVPEVFAITELDNNNLRLRVSNNRGKIAGSSEGLAYYFKEVPPAANYKITTKVKIEDWEANNQVGFGIMLRGDVLYNTSDSSHTSDYVAVGALDQQMKGFYKTGDNQVKKGYEFDNALPPAPGNEYKLSLEKAGNVYILGINDENMVLPNFDGRMNFAGFWASRNTTVTYSDFTIEVDNRIVDEIVVDTSEMVTEFLLGQELDLTGIKVTAAYTDGSERELTEADYIVTGYDSREVGITTITINHSGRTVKLNLHIVPLTVTDLNVIYCPAKTDYYIGDTFDSAGLVVEAVYDDGFKTAELTEDLYELRIDNELADKNHIFQNPGEQEITVMSLETPETTSSFKVNVSDAAPIALKVTSKPEKTLYFLGDELELDGMAVYAAYDDGKEIRLMREEYEISALDTSEPGLKLLTVSHKDLTTSFTVEVKERELARIEVSAYPKTTYTVGESFTPDGMTVAAVYDSGDKEFLNEADYSINTEQFNSSTPGVYDIIISSNIGNTVLPVSVREEREIKWHQVIFGQSIHRDRNYVEVMDGVIELYAHGNAGKITGDHDGISFYYTVIDAKEDNFSLSADLRVFSYAKDPHDGQEAFGIMARDVIGEHMDSSVFAANIAAVGGFSGGTTLPNGTQLFIRKGVLATDGSEFLEDSGRFSKMIAPVKPESSTTYPESPYRVTLSKTNSGYVGSLNNEKKQIFYEPEILTLQDEEHIYVGFFVAREAHIEVYNIDMEITAAQTDPPRVHPPEEPTEPQFLILSLEKTSQTDFDLMLEANVDGLFTVKQGQEIMAQNKPVNAGEKFVLPTKIAEMGGTDFSITFLPDDTQYLTDYDKIVQNFTVEHRSYADGADIFVAPGGTSAGDGARANPLDLDTAIDFVLPGQKIIVMDGQYLRETPFEIKKYNDGTAEAGKYLVADEGARPVIDAGRRIPGAIVSGDFWHIKGIDFTRSAGNSHGMRVGGNNNIIENCRFYENGDTGFQISRTDLATDIEDWPANNLVLNCVSFDNRDPSGNNADGFAAKLTSGYGNVFKGCISHNNIDDGWDLYTKVGEGAIGPVHIIDCIAYHNGVLTDGTTGNGMNGFKLGGEGVHVAHILENSVAFGHRGIGITSNSNPGLIIKDSLAFNNTTNISLYTYTNIDTDFLVDGLVSIQEDPVGVSADDYPQEIEAGNNYLFDSSKSVNTAGEELAITQDALDRLNNLAELIRDEHAGINWGDFYEIVGPFLQ